MRIAAVVLLTACLHSGSSSPPDTDVTGPFTGSVEQFSVDSITLSTTTANSREVADDLNGDGHVDNELGSLTAALFSQGDLNRAGDQMIASRVIASTLEILADDHTNDDTVAVTYFGQPDATATRVGGTLVDGAFS